MSIGNIRYFYNAIDTNTIEKVVVLPVNDRVVYSYYANFITLEDVEALGLDSKMLARSVVAKIPKLYLRRL